MTAKPGLELELEDVLFLDDEEDDDELYYFYDNEENYWRLREQRGDMPIIKHSNLVDYLKQVLVWLYRLENYHVNREVNFYQTANPKEKPLYPDIFVIKSTKPFPEERGYQLGIDGPAPQLVIEIISAKTRKIDIGAKPGHKPQRYAQWGVLEYFAYDPAKRRGRSNIPRLYGWQMVDGNFVAIEAQPNGWMWSEQLDSWLVPDEAFLRLYDRELNMRQKKEEYEEQEKLASYLREEVERREKEASYLREEAERREKLASFQRELKAQQESENALKRAEAERAEKEAALQQAEAERAEKEAALQREAELNQELKLMAEKLRQLESNQ